MPFGPVCAKIREVELMLSAGDWRRIDIYTKISMKNPSFLLALFCVAGISAKPTAACGQSIVNGGFETGDFTGWTQGGNYAASDVVIPPNSINDAAHQPHSGLWQGWFGANPTSSFISQSLNLSGGSVYTIDFWLSNPIAGTASFQVDFGGVTLTNSLTQGSSLGSFPYHEFSYSVTNLPAGPAELKFTFENTPDWLLLDDVRLIRQSVPEGGPGVIFPLLTILGLGFYARASVKTVTRA